MFTQQELITIVKLCDIATRQGGLEVANVAMPIVNKIQQQLQAMQRQPAVEKSDAV